jgi:hypothetical protein
VELVYDPMVLPGVMIARPRVAGVLHQWPVTTAMHSSDGRDDISDPLLLAFTIATGDLTSAVSRY